MKRNNETSLKLVVKETRSGVKLLNLIVNDFEFIMTTRNTQVERKILEDKNLKEIPIYIELVEKLDKNNKPYLSHDLYAENEKYLISLYIADKNLTFMFNGYIRKLIQTMLNDEELIKYGYAL